MYQPKTVLVPIDFSEHSARALRRALNVVQGTGAKLCVLHVVRAIPYAVGDAWLDESIIRKFQSDMEAAARDEIAKFVGRFSGAQGLSIECSVRSGIPYEQIVQEAAERSADIIVMASHGRTGIKEHLLGSTAEKVVRHAACDVLVVRSGG